MAIIMMMMMMMNAWRVTHALKTKNLGYQEKNFSSWASSWHRNLK